MTDDQIKALREAAEKPNRVQGMVRSIDQWRSMEPLDVVTGSHAECALHDAKNDIEVLWRKVNSQAAEIERLREALEQIEQQLDYGQINMALHITRRALEGSN